MKRLRLISLIAVIVALLAPQLATAHLNGQPFVQVDGQPVGTDLSGNFYAGKIWDLAPSTYVVGTPITFAIDRTVLTSLSVQYRWVWPDNSITYDPGTSVSHTFTKPGTYIVTLQSKGPSDPTYSTQLDTIGVNVVPTANYHIPTAAIAVTQLGVGIVRFTVTPQLDPSAHLTNVLWNFGDGGTATGTTGTGATTKHTYTQAGDFKLVPAVQVKDSNGLYRDFVFNIQSADATFGASSYSGQAGASVKLTQLPQNKQALAAVGAAALVAMATIFGVVWKTGGRKRRPAPKPRRRSPKRPR